MSFETILCDTQGPLAIIKVNRPKVLNAINAQVLTELKACFEGIKNNHSLRGAILTGSGEKAFVAGADIAAMQNMTALDARRFVELGHQTMRTIETMPFPVLAAVNGFALGGGLELALSCDFIYASQNAKLGLPEVNLGIFPGFGGTQRLPRVIGRSRAKELIYTARMLSAEEALSWGLVNKVVDPTSLLDECKKTMETIAKKGPVAISVAKQVVNEGADLSLTSALHLEETAFPLMFATEDKTEGVRAFLDKREAKFNGK